MSLTVQSAPQEVAMDQRFTITLSTDQRSSNTATVSVVRVTELEDPDGNPYDIPLQGPTKVTVDGKGAASFNMWFSGRPALVEGRRWPIPFELQSNGRTVKKVTVYVDCVEQ
jgi:hypothetical protein